MYVVVGDEHADVFPFQLEDDALDVLDGDGVDTGERLVKKHELGVDGQGAGDLGAAALTARQLYALALAHMLQAKLVEQLFQLLATVGFLHLLELHDGVDVFLDAHLPKHRGLLGQVADAFLGAFVHRQVGDVLVFEEDLPRIGLDETHHHVECGCLSCAIGTQQTYDLSLLHFDVDVVDHGALTVFLHQMFSSQLHL